jgi:hypothetical protein
LILHAVIACGPLALTGVAKQIGLAVSIFIAALTNLTTRATRAAAVYVTLRPILLAIFTGSGHFLTRTGLTATALTVGTLLTAFPIRARIALAAAVLIGLRPVLNAIGTTRCTARAFQAIRRLAVRISRTRFALTSEARTTAICASFIGILRSIST